MNMQNKLHRRLQEGFTLVELMVVVAIIGILATIAIPQYQKFQAKSRQSEARLALNAVYTVMQTFATDNNSYTDCIGRIGYARDGTKFYYAVGMQASSGNVCGPNGTQSCAEYAWPLDSTGAVVAAQVSTCADATVGDTHFLANFKENAAALPTRAQLPTAGVKANNSAAALIGRHSLPAGPGFVAGAVGNVSGTVMDQWTIGSTKQIVNDQSGI